MNYDKPYQPRPNSGSLFAKKSKAKPTSPDYFGDILIKVSDYQIINGEIKVSLSGWKKVSATGKQFLSLAASAPRDEQIPQNNYNQPSPVDDDSCPF
jgi:hypothetical protein